MTSYTSNTGALSAVGGHLPRVQIVQPGALAPVTYNTASGVVQPGDLVAASGVGQSLGSHTQGGRVATVTTTPDFSSSASVLGGSRSQYAVAMKQVQVFNQQNAASLTDGPVELVNADIVDGEYVREVRDGIVALTVVKPDDAFKPGNFVTWDPAASRPSGMAGTGAWKITTSQGKALGQVVSFRAVGTNDGGILYVRLMLGE